METPQFVEYIRRGITQIPHFDTSDVPDLVPPFLHLIKAPAHGPLGFIHTNNKAGEPEQEVDTGFYHRDGQSSPDGTLYDRKWIFHYRQTLPRLLEERNPSFLKAHMPWIKKLAHVHARCVHFCHGVLEQIDRAYPHFRLRALFDPIATRAEHVLRLIAYADTQQPFLGKAHRDRSAQTMALFESHPGLEGLVNRRYVARSSAPNRPLLFMGGSLAEVMQNEVPAFRHRVRYTNNTRVNEQVIRFSVVFFFHARPGTLLKRPTH
ncbi:MAG TPA: 2OG-Fe(II) oxygenase family protein [Candidatus Kapabacteria bacterium]|nr:2OG-Fe(II) oxygenase family protein [Candidatus Kapabacteria bacterium]